MQLKFYSQPFKTLAFCGLLFFFTSGFAMEQRDKPAIAETKQNKELAARNITRSVAILDTALAHYFKGEEMVMGRFFNPYTGKLSDEKGSVWMYTSAIEAVNSLLVALQKAQQQGHQDLYDQHFNRFEKILSSLYANADYYLGSFELVSYTQTKTWEVYAVDRANEKGKANVTGILNVYDDQMWLIRELLDSYKITGNPKYLEKAEYLTDYVIDGWDTTRDENGNENGGIPWGPGYVTKHACSNGPLISSLVWLHEIYKDKEDQITYRYIERNGRRSAKKRSKKEHYLDYAKKVYNWQRDNLLNNKGVYTDMMGGCGDCKISYETVEGIKYRANTKLTEAVGEPYTYNSGSMISGASDLYRATGERKYLEEGSELAKNSFLVFASLGQEIPGYYSYNVKGFRNWFNGILLRGYKDLSMNDSNVYQYIKSFQENLDYGYEHHNYKGFLPTNLLTGWQNDKNEQGVEGMFQFAFAAKYSLLATLEFDKTI